MFPLTMIWGFIAGNWRSILPFGAIAILGLLLVIARGDARHWRMKAQRCEDLRMLDRQAYQAAAEKARADNLATVRRIETAQAAATAQAEKETTDALRRARADADAYLARMRHQLATAEGAGGSSATGQAAQPTYGIDEAGRVPVLVSDVRVCTENTVIAQQWQAWWQGQAAVAR